MTRTDDTAIASCNCRGRWPWLVMPPDPRQVPEHGLTVPSFRASWFLAASPRDTCNCVPVRPPELGDPAVGHAIARTAACHRRASNGHCNARRSSCRVSPRRRRKGYQDHHELDPVLEAALDNEAARLGAIEDPVQAVHAVNEFCNGLKDALLRGGEPRLLAIIELYADPGSYQRVADATELSKTRVGQPMRETRRRGLSSEAGASSKTDGRR